MSVFSGAKKVKKPEKAETAKKPAKKTTKKKES